MKRLLLSLGFLLCVLVSNAQLEWSTKDYSAYDESRGYAWNLPWDRNHTWTKQNGLEAHTVFRAIQPQTGMVAFLNFHPFTADPIYDSILDVYDKMVDLFSYQDKKMASRGIVISSRDTSPSMLNNTPAIRAYYISKEKKNGKIVITHCLQYVLKCDMGTYIVTTKCFNSAYVKYGIAYMEGILKGFILLTEDE